MLNMKNRFIICLLFFYLNCFSQKNNDSIILINKNDKLISLLSINKDTTMFSLGVYINGFESKQKRENELKKFKNQKKDKELPTFSINFLSSEKPKRICSLLNLKYIELKEFNPNIIIANPTYILIKQKKGGYLMWKCILNSIE